MKFWIDGKKYSVGACAASDNRVLNVGEMVYCSAIRKVAKVTDKRNPRKCKNCWDFYLEGRGNKVFSRSDLYFLNEVATPPRKFKAEALPEGEIPGTGELNPYDGQMPTINRTSFFESQND